MIKAVVVDDEALTGEHICRQLKSSGVEISGCFLNPFEALDKVNILKPDVMFLDIEMPEMSGLDLAERVYSSGYECEIVFITAYNQYAIEAFEVNALDYLLKPVMAERLNQALERVKKRRMAASVSTIENVNKKIRVSLFGSLSLYVGDENKPIHWVTAKSAEVFVFMLLQRGEKEISKWKISEAIWPDKDKGKADINLRSTISRLNKTLRENAIGISVISTGNAYKLNCEDIDLDVDAFKLEKLVLDSNEINTENVQYYTSVVLSYIDMLLEEFSSEWCDALRVKYHRYFINAAHKLVKHYDKIGVEPLKILNIIDLITKYEPYDEKIREIELKLQYRIEGKQGAAKYYKLYLDMLKKDLGIEPSESMKKVYKYIMKQ